MRVITTTLSGVLIIEPKLFTDERGYFLESCQTERYLAQGIPPFVQDNLSCSQKNVVRGLHYQLERPQGKLITVVEGAILDVALDIRLSSSTFGQVMCVELNDTDHKQLYVPPGFAHGFCVLSDQAKVLYKCTDYYHLPSERGIYWNDASLQIPWPKEHMIVSVKDTEYLPLNQIAKDQLFS